MGRVVHILRRANTEFVVRISPNEEKRVLQANSGSQIVVTVFPFDRHYPPMRMRTRAASTLVGHML